MATNCPWTIINDLHTHYGATNPAEKEVNESKWGVRWNPSNPIKDLFDCLEECYTIAIIALPPYVMEQMIDNALIAIQQTGLYELAILK